MAGQIHPIVVRAVLGGLERVAPEVLPAPERLAPLLEAVEGVPLAPYRAVLREILARGGAGALVAAGVTLEEVSHPFLFVLLNSETPRQVLDKEARLERFIHSRHRVEVVAERETALALVHVSDDDEPPEPAEDLAACGQHATLFAQIGCRDLRVRFPDAGTGWLRPGEPIEGTEGFARWDFEWSALVPTRRPMPGLDELLLGGLDERPLAEAPPVVAALERVVRRDLGRSWRLDEVATALDRSPRSLQRALSTAGTRFSAELDRLRVDEAARLLGGSDLSITEIGYVCGFADGAHFGRRFRKRFAKSPSAYRSAVTSP